MLSTDFLPSGKIPHPEAQELAKAAVKSVAKASPGKDGISYLIQVSESGVETALSAAYLAEVLRLTGTTSLEEALLHLRKNRE